MLILFHMHDDDACASGDGDSTLARAAAAGDKAAFEQLIRKYERFVFRTAFYVTGNTEDASDLAQEILLKVWHGLPSFRGDAKFFTWLARIAKNASADYLRRKSRAPKTESLSGSPEDADDAPPPEPADPDADPHDACTRREQAALLHAAMRTLSEEHRMIVQLRDMEGYSYEALARMLGVEIGTVKSRLHRAREQLRAYLSAHGFFE